MNILTLRDVAVMANVPYTTVHHQRKLGRLPATRVGHQWMVTIEDAEAFARDYVRFGREGGSA